MINESPGNASEAYVRSCRELVIEELTLADLLRKIAAEVPQHTALKLLKDPATGVQPSWTYAQLLAASEAMARRLLQKFSPGEHIALWSSNRPEWLFVEFGAAFAGLVLVAVSPAASPRDLRYVLEQSDSAGIIYSRRMGSNDGAAVLEDIRGECPRLREALSFEDRRWQEDLSGGGSPLPQVRPHDPAIIQYTSGTTGKPKGALLAHRSLVNAAKSAESGFELERGSVWLNTVPLYTTSGCVFTTLAAMWNRGTQILLPHFDAQLVFRGVSEERANWIPLVPTMALAVLEHPARPSCNFSSVKVVVAGGSPVAPELVRRVERDLGVDFMMVFGQTESAAAVCLTYRQDTIEHRTATIGYPLGGLEIRVSDPRTNETVRRGEVGEICIRGPTTMLGYYNMRDATAESLDADGWLHSGDLGAIDEDGYARITGRLKDLIIRGGSNIYPREIEDALQEHPAIAESSVFGIPDAKYGELVVAAVRLKDTAELDRAAIETFLSARIARYKLPAHIWVVDRFPLTPSGKVQKFELRNRFLAESGA